MAEEKKRKPRRSLEFRVEFQNPNERIAGSETCCKLLKEGSRFYEYLVALRDHLDQKLPKTTRPEDQPLRIRVIQFKRNFDNDDLLRRRAQVLEGMEIKVSEYSMYRVSKRGAVLELALALDIFDDVEGDYEGLDTFAEFVQVDIREYVGKGKALENFMHKVMRLATEFTQRYSE